MKKMLILAAVLVMTGCAHHDRGVIEKLGTVTISGFEFSECNRVGSTGAAIHAGSSETYLCGYTVKELMDLAGTNYKNLSFYGDAKPEREDK